jgi:hypothetical protein
MGRVPLVGRAKNRGLDVEADGSHARILIRGSSNGREGAAQDEKHSLKAAGEDISLGFTGDIFPGRTERQNY